MPACEPGQVEDGGAGLSDSGRQADADNVIKVIFKRLKQLYDLQKLVTPWQIKAFVRITAALNIKH